MKKKSRADEVYKIACAVTNKKSRAAVKKVAQLKKVAGIYWHLQLHTYSSKMFRDVHTLFILCSYNYS